MTPVLSFMIGMLIGTIIIFALGIWFVSRDNKKRKMIEQIKIEGYFK